MQNFKIETSADAKIKYLSIHDQEEFDVPFAKNLPWNNFGRKNIGYIYAISQGAISIFDFDDNNYVSAI